MLKLSPIKSLLAAIFVSSLCACTHPSLREEHYGDGTIKTKDAFIRTDDDAMIRHGIQLAWYPDGGKESMETYVAGYRQGYSFRWHPNGKLKSLEHFTDGMRDGQAKFWDEAGRIIACFTPEGAECPRPLAGTAEAEAATQLLAFTP